MKKYLILLILIIVFPSLAQTKEAVTSSGEIFILHSDGTWSKKTTDKEKINLKNFNEPYYLNGGDLVSLEKVKAKYEAKVKALGYGGVKTQLIAFKAKSNIRFNNQSIPKIVFKYEGLLNPEDLFTVIKANEKRKKRQFIQSSIALGGNARDTSENEVTFKLKKIEKNTYEIIFDDILKKGEYGIIPALNSGQTAMGYSYTIKIYCFGID
ncbi:hypothetical protein [Tenacibaculum ascidiaceicola]|uniref:hypothetical protein n=1 Tax=Tenacibaculum ascidiaceicola TaxID=1699411 RepID=UPI003CE47CA2